MKRPSPRACPKCGSCDVAAPDKSQQRPWHCNHCGHETMKQFPTVGALPGPIGSASFKSHATTGGFGTRRIQPTGNKFS